VHHSILKGEKEEKENTAMVNAPVDALFTRDGSE